ncbi:hypothetical protein [Hellea balneolensis]|uniref:hypothetical protein n=1 Tax=Hellea balneolensis TaxID=287478 RepID=UPI0003F64F3B|nr:hypothetical protein [Hellea balneolensis]
MKRIAIIFLTVFSIAGCNPKKIETKHSVNGQITKEFVSQIMVEYQTNKFNTLVISSYGGLEEAAIELADFIHENKIKVTAKNVCMSSCAMYILPSGSSSYVMDDTLVAFHPSVISFEEFIDMSQVPTSRQSYLKNSYASIYRFHEIHSIDNTLVKRALDVLTPLCVNDVSNPMNLRLQYSFWIPDKKNLEKHGYIFLGYWPENRQEAEALVSLRIKPGVEWVFGQGEKKIENNEITKLAFRSICNE